MAKFVFNLGIICMQDKTNLTEKIIIYVKPEEKQALLEYMLKDT